MVYLFQNISLYTRGMEIRTSQHAPAAEPTPAGSMTGPPRRVVLDTNAVLDWLLFDGPGVQPMIAAVKQGRLLPITNDACFAELERVLRYPRLRLDTAQRGALLAAYRTAATWIDAAAGEDVPRCRDRDDQKFLDLAAAARAHFLVTRDARVLAMSRRMEKRFGVRVVTQDGLNAILRA
jgi:putative PIN family toxin of toxin-antitoxin system